MSVEELPSVQREPVEGTCSGCGAHALQRYPVLSEGGWFMVTKCPHCLRDADRRPWRLLGPISLTSEGLDLS